MNCFSLSQSHCQSDIGRVCRRDELPAGQAYAGRASRSFVSVVLFILPLLFVSSGCSLFVIAGKMLTGDPKVVSPFTAATGRKLKDSKEPVVVICSAPHRLLNLVPSIQIDIADRVTRDLEIQGIQVVPAGDVARWFDDHGDWGDYSELAKEFRAGYVIHIDMRQFNHLIPESPNLMSGIAEGHLSVYSASGRSGEKKQILVSVTPLFDRDFKVQFPTSYPVPRESRSEEQFIQDFLDRTALHISQHLYDYRMGESIH
ncbi:MAG: hypothetical protein R3C49_08520 [Planctomycetaceae bacterium]